TGVTRPAARRATAGPRPGGDLGRQQRRAQRESALLLRVPRLPLGTRRVAAPRPQALGSGWEVRHESPGRIRFQNERLHRRRELCQAIERELMSVLGVENYQTSSLTGTVLILYESKQLRKH